MVDETTLMFEQPLKALLKVASHFMFSRATPLVFSNDLMPPNPKSDSVKVMSSPVSRRGRGVPGNHIATTHSAIGIRKKFVIRPKRTNPHDGWPCTCHKDGWVFALSDVCLSLSRIQSNQFAFQLGFDVGLGILILNELVNDRSSQP